MWLLPIGLVIGRARIGEKTDGADAEVVLVAVATVMTSERPASRLLLAGGSAAMEEK